MPGETCRPTGLKPTLRQAAIVVLWAGVMLAAARTLIRWHVFGSRVDFDCMMVPLLAGGFPVPILAVLLGTLDRPGPVRDWYRACGMAGSNVLGGLLFLLQEPVCLALTGGPTPIFFMSPFIGAVGLWSGRKLWQLARPADCPRCGRRAVIAVKPPTRPGSRRMVNTGKDGWCAACGAEFDREDATAAWRPRAVGGAVTDSGALRQAP